MTPLTASAAPPLLAASLSESSLVALVIIVLAVMGIVLVLLLIFLPRWLRKRIGAKVQRIDRARDDAYNRLQAAHGLENFLEREGLRAPEATLLLEQAEAKYEAHRYPEALELAKQATESMAQTRKQAMALASASPPATLETPGTSAVAALPAGAPVASPPPEPVVYRDISRRVGDRDPDEGAPTSPAAGMPAPDERKPTPLQVGPNDGDGEPEGGEGGPENTEDSVSAQARKLPKNFLESKFMLNTLRQELSDLPEDRQKGPEGREAQDCATKSQAAFDRKDYNESLRLALRGRRRLGGGGLSTISLSPATVVESPPAQPSPTAQRSSALPVAAPGATAAEPLVCARCQKVNNQGDRFCRGCGAPLSPPKCPRCQKVVAPDDQFCHGCGAPLGGVA